MFRKIVKFKDGQYAVRRLGILRWEYLDIKDYDYYWGILYVNNYCKGTLKEVRYAIDNIKKVKEKEGTDYGTPIDNKELSK